MPPLDPLTAAHRTAQLVNRSGVLRRAVDVFARFDPGDIAGSWDRIGTPLVDLTLAGRSRSAALSAAYFDMFRLGSGARGAFTATMAAAPNPADTAAWLEIAGPQVAGVLSARGRPDVYEQTFTNLAGSIGRNVLDGGRETITGSVDDDPECLGWARVTADDPCAFCAELASQGPAYKSEESARYTAAGDAYHLHCACEPEPVYDRDQPWPGRAEEFRDMWDSAGGDHSAFRAAYDAADGDAERFYAEIGGA